MKFALSDFSLPREIKEDSNFWFEKQTSLLEIFERFIENRIDYIENVDIPMAMAKTLQTKYNLVGKRRKELIMWDSSWPIPKLGFFLFNALISSGR